MKINTYTHHIIRTSSLIIWKSLLNTSSRTIILIIKINQCERMNKFGARQLIEESVIGAKTGRTCVKTSKNKIFIKN